jgi:hypothetical protein
MSIPTPHEHPITAAPSILRLSVGQRVVAVTAIVAVLWGIVLWAMM